VQVLGLFGELIEADSWTAGFPRPSLVRRERRPRQVDDKIPFGGTQIAAEGVGGIQQQDSLGQSFTRLANSKCWP
jgi:hypothetical protein